jgi:hypothetical protein
MIALIIIAIIGVLIIAFMVYRYLKVNAQNRRLLKEQFERIKPLYDRIINNGQITQEDVYPFAKNIKTRELTFNFLKSKNLADLFPDDYFSIVKASEANLASWLEFPTELDACPDEMEHVKRVSIDFDGENNFFHYEVFKYRMNEPHWAAKNGWMIGVAGPYFDDSKPYDLPKATFSRTGSTLANTNPDDEAKWVHENIALKR